MSKLIRQRIASALAVALAALLLALPGLALAEEVGSQVVDLPSDQEKVADYTTTFKVSKVDATDGAAVSGATLAIYKADDLDTPLVTWKTDEGTKAFERWLDEANKVGLNQDQEYVLRELEAPAGYEKAADTHFTIKSYGVDEATKKFATTLQVSGAGEKVGEDGIRLSERRSDNWETVYQRTGDTTQGTNDTTGGTTTGLGNLVKTDDPTVLAPLYMLATAGLLLVGVALRRHRAAD